MTATPVPINPLVPKGRPARTERTGWPTVLAFLAPALLLITIFLVYPVISTLRMSVDRGLGGEFTRFVGLDNYISLFQTPSFVGSIINNVLWTVFYTGFVILFGLFIAVIAMRVRYESVIKAIVFLPMAIAATALGVIWGFVYALDPQIGTLNALLGIIVYRPGSLILLLPYLGSAAPRAQLAVLIANGGGGLGCC